MSDGRTMPAALAAGVLAAMATLVPAAAQTRPVPAAARPAEPSCAEYGPGFQAALGSSTCVKTGGRVRMEGQLAKQKARSAPTTGSTAQGRVFMDARSQTELGPMRVFVRAGVGRTTGNAGERP